MANTIVCFDVDERYTKKALEIGDLLRPHCERRVDELLKQGYNLRTALVVGAKPTVLAETYNVNQLDLEYLWLSEMFELTTVRLLTNGLNRIKAKNQRK